MTWGSCTASLNNEMYVFGGQNKLHAADYTQYQVNFHKNDISEIELYLSWPRWQIANWRQLDNCLLVFAMVPVIHSRLGSCFVLPTTKMEPQVYTNVIRKFIPFVSRASLIWTQLLTVTEWDDYTPHGSRWQCSAKTFYYGVFDAYRWKLTWIMYF